MDSGIVIGVEVRRRKGQRNGSFSGAVVRTATAVLLRCECEPLPDVSRWNATLTPQQVSDALVELGEALGGLIVGVKMYSPEMERGTHKVIGPAFTVRVSHLDLPASRHEESAANLTDGDMIY